jgi:hypothetical protein
LVKKQLARMTLSAKYETAYNCILAAKITVLWLQQRTICDVNKNNNKQIKDLHAGAS